MKVGQLQYIEFLNDSENEVIKTLFVVIVKPTEWKCCCMLLNLYESIASYTEKQNDNRELECRQLNIPDDNKFALK